MSARLDFKGDYMGFTYNGRHSSEFGIVRVSNGSRFDENLLPTMQDKTVQVPGGDGTYYFGSQYKQRQFTIQFAFDDLTEKDIDNLKQWLGDKGEHELIFDERPHKVYRAKVTGTATIKYIPFAEDTNNRLYKGEGSIQFTCFYPFARCRSTDLSVYGLIKIQSPTMGSLYYYYDEDAEQFKSEYCTSSNPTKVYYNLDAGHDIKNINEWIGASRIMKGGNFGDIPVSFCYTLNGSGMFNFSPEFKEDSVTIPKPLLSWDITDGKSYEINTKTGLAVNGDKIIGNRYVFGNTLLKIPQGQQYFYLWHNNTWEEHPISDLTFICEYI